MFSMRHFIGLIEAATAPPRGYSKRSNFLAELERMAEDPDEPTIGEFDSQVSGSSKPSIGPSAAPSMADAWDFNTSAVGNFVSDQRAQAQQQGLYNPTSGVTPRGMMDVAKRVASIR